jgi:phosphohistidine phosphatase
MHQLILLRHAQALSATPGLSDHDRPLAEAGRRAAGAVGQAMRRAGLTPDVVLVSPALRAQQTLEAAAVWDEQPNVDTLPALYMATGNQLRDALRALPETVRCALVVGHNPGLHDLARSLAGPALSGTASDRPELRRLAAEYPTATLAEFMVTTAWRKLGPGAAALQRFLQPRDLKLA